MWEESLGGILLEGVLWDVVWCQKSNTTFDVNPLSIFMYLSDKPHLIAQLPPTQPLPFGLLTHVGASHAGGIMQGGVPCDRSPVWEQSHGEESQWEDLVLRNYMATVDQNVQVLSKIIQFPPPN